MAVPRGWCSQAQTAVEPLHDAGIVSAHRKVSPVIFDRFRMHQMTVLIIAPTQMEAVAAFARAG
jgi:hypothetical protein